jgi:hypothetical protein
MAASGQIQSGPQQQQSATGAATAGQVQMVGAIQQGNMTFHQQQQQPDQEQDSLSGMVVSGAAAAASQTVTTDAALLESLAEVTQNIDDHQAHEDNERYVTLDEVTANCFPARPVAVTLGVPQSTFSNSLLLLSSHIWHHTNLFIHNYSNTVLMNKLYLYSIIVIIIIFISSTSSSGSNRRKLFTEHYQYGKPIF